MIKAIVTYKYRGCRGAVGQTVGADGAGVYAKVFYDDTNLREFVQGLATTVGISEIHVVHNEELYVGPAITFEGVPDVSI